MTDDRNQDYPTGPAEVTGEPADLEQVLAPQQAPMDPAAGGPDVEEETIEETSTDDLSVQGGD